MSSAIVLTVFPLFLQGVRATIFPESTDFRPIPSAAIRLQDNSPREYYIQGEIPSPPQTVIKEEVPYRPDFKPDDERLFVSSNQPGGPADFMASGESFSRFYPNGEPAIGPVATPLPDDIYLAEQSSLAKVVPNAPPTAGSSDIWLLRNGPNDQLVPERWVKVQVPTERVVEVVNQDQSPNIITNKFKSIPPPPPPPVKTLPPPPQPAPGSTVQQVWLRAPSGYDTQKIYQTTGTVVQEVPSVKQIDVPSPKVKQFVQVQNTKDLFPQPPPVPVVSKTVAPSPFSLPPPPPPAKSVDITGSKQIVAPPSPVGVIQNGDAIFVGKDGALQPIRHIWVPTSSQTGKFVSVPVTDSVDKGKSITNKGAPADVVPISVSDTWVLKQDGPIPRFEPQTPVLQSQVVQGGKVVIDQTPVIQSQVVQGGKVVIDQTPVIQSQVVQGGKVVIDQTPLIQIDSSKTPPTLGKSISPAPRPLDIWPVRKDIPDAKVMGKTDFASPVPIPLPKSDAIVIDKTLLTPVVPQKTLSQKTYRFAGNILSPLPALPPPPPPKIAPVFKSKPPCPVTPQKYAFPPKNIAVPPAFPAPAAVVKRQPLTRIVRVNRYPYGSYYVLNPRFRPSLYSYPRPRIIASNGLVRLVAAKPVTVPIQTRPAVIPVPSPKAPIVFPNVQTASRLRYVYPWGSYLRTIPVPGNSVYSLSPSIPAKIEVAGSSSSESSSSESSSSESASIPSKPAPKKRKTPAPPLSSESSSSEEKETEVPKEEEPTAEAEPSAALEVEAEDESLEVEAEPESTEPEKETEEEATAESEAQESIEAAESQLMLQIQNLPEASEDSKPTAKPYLFEFNQRDSAGTIQHRKEMSDADGTVTGSYGYKQFNGTYRTVVYIADKGGYRVVVNSNEPNTISHQSADANFVSNQQPGSTANTAKVSEVTETSTQESKLVESVRD